MCPKQPVARFWVTQFCGDQASLMYNLKLLILVTIAHQTLCSYLTQWQVDKADAPPFQNFASIALDSAMTEKGQRRKKRITQVWDTTDHLTDDQKGRTPAKNKEQAILMGTFPWAGELAIKWDEEQRYQVGLSFESTASGLKQWLMLWLLSCWRPNLSDVFSFFCCPLSTHHYQPCCWW